LLKFNRKEDNDMTRPAKILIIITLVFFSCSLSTKAGEELSITLKQAVRLALQNNPTALQASETVAIQQAEVTGAVGEFLPTVSANIRGYQQYDSGQNVAGQSTGSTDSHTAFNRNFGVMDITATANLKVFDGLSNVASLKRARLERDAARTAKLWTEQSLAYAVASRFYQVLKSRELVALKEKQLEQNHMQLEKIESFYKAGKTSVTDLFQQKAELSQAKKQLLEAENTLRVNQLTLTQILGLPESTGLSIIEPKEASASFLSLPDAYENALGSAIGNRADLKSQSLTHKARAQDVTMAYAGYWPKINLFASIGTGYSTLDDGSSFTDQFTQGKAVGTVGIVLSIPLFDGLDTHAAVTKAKAEQKITKLENVKLRQQAAVDLLQAIEEYKTTVRQVEVAQSYAEATGLALEAMQERYDVRASTLLELSSARTAYFEALYDSIDAMYTQTTQRLAVAYQEGNLMETLNTLYKGANQ